MNLYDTEPCDDEIKKFRITCGEVYILTNIIETSKKILSIDLINSNKLDLNTLHLIIPKLMKSIKPIINNEIVADMFYFYLSSLNEKIEKYMTKTNDIKLSVNDFCVISRTKCNNGLLNDSQQYKVYVYVKTKVDLI